MLWQKLSEATPEEVEPLGLFGAQLANCSVGPSLWGPGESLVFFQVKGTGNSSRKDALYPQKAEPCPPETMRAKTRLHCEDKKVELMIVVPWRALGEVRKDLTSLE